MGFSRQCCVCLQVLEADKAKSTIRVGAGMRYTEFLKEAQKAGMSVQVRLKLQHVLALVPPALKARLLATPRILLGPAMHVSWFRLAKVVASSVLDSGRHW